jgi:DMSO/TMAO reductase YedYZ molybdopterin-dependent catalytic subunit
MIKKRKGLHALYAQDTSAADRRLWGRLSDPITRRGFLHNAGLSAMAAVVGAHIPYARFMPSGLIPAALAQSTSDFEIEGKDGLVVLNDRPLNAETPAHLLDDALTPNARMFVRNNGIVPDHSDINADDWALTIKGESVAREARLTLGELKKRFKTHTYALQLECGGNGRHEFVPPASGNQWTVGAIGCPEWTGVRLRDVLDFVGYKDDAVYVAYLGADKHLSGDAKKAPISRGVPMAKALEDETLLAFAMNGEPLPAPHGYPLRLVCGGWPGSVSGKWLSTLLVRDRVHDGPKMNGKSYRVPCDNVAPGSDVPDSKMCIIESMPVKSLITYPKSGIEHALKNSLNVRGHAWAGDLAVSAVHTSVDFGATWQPAKLSSPPNRLAWQSWQTQVRFDQPGYYEIWARATDTQGRAQPMVVPGWNPKGYLNNACHRIAVLAA